MKSTCLRILNAVLSSFLIALGFSACDKETPLMYGSPYAKHEIKGKVENSAKQGVSGMEVIVKELVDIDGVDEVNTYNTDTIYSNNKGEFLYTREHARIHTKYRIVYKDILDGKYETDSTTILMNNPTGGKGWYEGMDSRTITITLTEKKSEEKE